MAGSKNSTHWSHSTDNKKPTNWWGRQNAAPQTFDPKLSDTTFSDVFLNCDIYRPEVADDVITSVAVGQIGMDVRGKFGDSWLNSGRIIRLLV